MEFIRGLINLKNKQQDCVATIGNFDGVHLGHQAVLNELKQLASQLGILSTVIIFEPQPIEFFAPDKAPSRLTRLGEKLAQFVQHGIDRVICLKFDHDMAGMSASAFIQQILVDAVGVKSMIIGDDFRFAKNREGNYQTLVEQGQRLGFEVKMMPSFVTDSERVSSTLIRSALAVGDIAKANHMLGRPYRISGRVVHGDKRGRRLGFATANIELKRYLSPLFGIFSGRVYGVSGSAKDAVIYVGSRPVYQGEKVILEVHILDFDQDIYGKQVQVEFIKKIRDEGNIDSEQALIAQINIDIADAKKSLEKLS